MLVVFRSLAKLFLKGKMKVLFVSVYFTKVVTFQPKTTGVIHTCSSRSWKGLSTSRPNPYQVFLQQQQKL